MQKGYCIEDIHFEKGDIAVIGDVLDDRGSEAIRLVNSLSITSMQMNYIVSDMSLVINQKIIQCDALDDVLKPFVDRSILLEATTLGFPELLQCCLTLQAMRASCVKILYLEPAKYYTPERYKKLLSKRDFELSEDYEGFVGIPRSVMSLESCESIKVSFLVGYEGQRLDRAFQELPLDPSTCNIIFGVPAFQPGWEMDAFSNNVRAMQLRNVMNRVFFCGADNPLAVFELLERQYQTKSPEQAFFVVPIGTKPHGIGTALFASKYHDVGVLYDHPCRREKRSQRIGAYHLFEVSFT